MSSLVFPRCLIHPAITEWRFGGLMILRGGMAILLAFGLGACATSGEVGLLPAATAPAATPAAPPPATGEWKFDSRVDRATGKPVGKAFVLTMRVSRRAGRAFSRPAGLQLQCFKYKPTVQMRFSDRVGSRFSATMTYRFDDKPPRNAAARFLPDYKTVVIDDEPAVQQFVAELRSAETLYVTVNSLVVGATRAEFPVRSAGPAIESGFGECPLPAPPPPRRAGTQT